MIRLDGDDIFVNNTFDRRRWSAPLIQDPDELSGYMRALHLIGKRIVRIVAIGLGYDLTRDYVEEAAYDQLDNLPEYERHQACDYSNIDPEMVLKRTAEIDEPIIIFFDDGESLEIDFSCSTEVRVSMNCIPGGIQAGVIPNNFDASILYSPCIGQTITTIEIGRTDTVDEELPTPYGTEWKMQKEFIARMTIRLDNGCGLCFEPDIDYGEVLAVDKNDEILSIRFKELRTALNNWEDREERSERSRNK